MKKNFLLTTLLLLGIGVSTSQAKGVTGLVAQNYQSNIKGGRVILYEDFEADEAALDSFVEGENMARIEIVNGENNKYISVGEGVSFATLLADCETVKNKEAMLQFNYFRPKTKADYCDRIDVGGDQGKLIMYIENGTVRFQIIPTRGETYDFKSKAKIKSGENYAFSFSFDHSAHTLKFTGNGKLLIEESTEPDVLSPRYFSKMGLTNRSKTPFFIDNIQLIDSNPVELNIKEFALPHQFGPAYVDQANAKVSIKVYKNSKMQDVRPFLRCSYATTLEPAMGTPVDLSQPLEYTVSSQDGKKSKTWKVQITECEYEEPCVLRVTGDDKSSVVNWEAKNYQERGVQMMLNTDGKPHLQLVKEGRIGKGLKFISPPDVPNTGDNKLRVELRLGGEITKDPVEFDDYPNEPAWDWQLSEGAERYIGLSFKMDKDLEFHPSDKFTDFFQIKQSGSRYEGGNAWVIFGPRMHMSGEGPVDDFEFSWRYGRDMNHFSGNSIRIGKLEKDVWYDFVFGMRFSKKANDGFMKVWYKRSDEKEYKLLEKLNIKNGFLNNSSTMLTTQCGIYRARTKAAMVVYYDEIRVARTFEEARIQER